MAGNHIIKNKPVDVKKALSKAELSKIQNNKNTSNQTDQGGKAPDWNARDAGNAMGNDVWSGPRGACGPPMNMGGGMGGGGGYGTGPNWGMIFKTNTNEQGRI